MSVNDTGEFFLFYVHGNLCFSTFCKKQRGMKERGVMDIFIILTYVMISQVYVRTSNCMLCFKYVQFIVS